MKTGTVGSGLVEENADFKYKFTLYLKSFGVIIFLMYVYTESSEVCIAKQGHYIQNQNMLAILNENVMVASVV